MKYLIVYLLSVLTITVNAQQITKGRVNGKVIDSGNKAPVDYATISIYKSGAQSPFNGISADAKGNFTINNIPEGDYQITVDFLGYQRATISHVIISKAAANVNLGIIVLQSAQKTLATVNITAKAPVVENKIDKMVYNAANDLTAQGGVALDVLKKVPQVTVDIDGNVELQGNANIRFLINGKPSSIFGASLSDALQAIPASQIKSIEVITSPGAKYDAAGTGGIINIVLKDSKVQGFNGSVNLSAGTRLENGSLNLNARKGNFGVNAFFSGNAQLNTKTLNTTSRTSTSGDTVSRLLQNGYSDVKRSGYQSGISLNWSISPKDELTGSVNLNHFGNHSTGITNQYQQTMPATGNLISDITSLRNSSSKFSSNSTDWSINYKKTFKKEGQELDVLYNSTYSKNQVDASQQTSYLNGGYQPSGILSSNPGIDHETDISIDYTQPVTKSFTLETGAKAVLENLNNTVVADSLLNNGTYVPNASQSNAFNYKRNIYAVYLSATFSVFKDFINGKAGLRYERTNTTADFAGTNIPGYNTFAPSLLLQHKFNDSQSVKFGYTYRVERPDYGDLNPFYNISDPHNISTGNPGLKPEIGHNFELGYSKSFEKGGNLYLSGFYRYNTNDIQSLTTYYSVLTIAGADYSNVSLTQRYNIGSQKAFGLNIFGSVPVTKSLNLRSNIQLGERTNSTPGLATVSGFAYRINLNATYQFGHDLVAEAFGNYNSSQKNIQGTRPSFAFYNLAVRKQFMDKKASIGLTAANPFSRYINQRSNTFGSNFYQDNVREVPFRSFGITLSYKFGKLEFKGKQEDTNQTPEPVQPQ